MEDFEKSKEDPVDQDIEYVRSKRKEVINHLTKDGIPNDDGQISLLLGALTDMDRTSLGRKKIKADNELAANNKQAADLIASIFNMPDSKKLGTNHVDGLIGTIPSVGDRLPVVDMLPGEMAVNPPQLDYNSFMNKTN
jgi:hypothetical protein